MVAGCGANASLPLRGVRAVAHARGSWPALHGRRDRGGGPQHLAILSQPPGSVRGTMRVTIQGETIDSHFGLQGTAEQVERRPRHRAAGWGGGERTPVPTTTVFA